MKVEQLYTKCLAQGAYYIESNGEVAIIDPLREVEQYIRMAKEAGAEIKYVFETHFHADFVSGHVTLGKKTGAKIVYGPTANPDFDAHIATDGEVFKIGDISLTVLHTPGHTMESSSFLLKDSEGNDQAIFTGDTLFLGDVGRPDLAQKSAKMTQDELAGILYDSIREKIMPLSDDIMVYPGHGAGSACGKNMMSITQDTLGNQKKMNYALREDMTREEFVQEVTNGLSQPPAYFPANVMMNVKGYKHIEDVLEAGKKALSVDEFVELEKEDDVLILDVRHQSIFEKAYIPNSLFVGIKGGFAPWVGELVKDVNKKILLVVDENDLEETITRLSRVGFDHILGYLKGGVDSYIASGRSTYAVNSISAEDLAHLFKSKNGNIDILDVRKTGEFKSSHIEGAPNICLSKIEDNLDKIGRDETCYVHCAGGYRSIIAASILQRHGFKNIVNILGGYGAIKKTSLPLEELSCSNS